MEIYNPKLDTFNTNMDNLNNRQVLAKRMLFI